MIRAKLWGGYMSPVAAGILTFCLVLGSAWLPRAVADDDDDGKFTFTILHNNDGESALLPSGVEGGVARFATVVREAKRQARRNGDDDDGDGRSAVIFVSSGDNFLASPAFTASVNNGTFYDAVVLDRLGYTTIDLGNHDFDFGPDLLAEFINEGFRKPGQPPYLSSNLDFTGEPALQALVDGGVIAKSTIVREGGRKIGIIGATTQDLPFISSPRGVIVNEVLPAVQAEVQRLKNRGVKIIILISHLQTVSEDIALAEQLRDVDVMVAGGGDELLANCQFVDDCASILLPSDLADNQPMGMPDGKPDALFGPYPIIATDADDKDVPVVTTSGQYGYLGRLVVEFDKQGHVVSWDGGPIRVVDETVGADGVREDRQMQRRVVKPVQDFVADLASNVIATSEVDLDGIRNNVRSMETNQGNLIADSQLWQAQQLAASFGVVPPQVALQNGGGIRNDSIIPSGTDGVSGGNITELHTFDMAPFPNFVTVVPDIPRDQFKEILENAVSRVAVFDGRFAQIAGFSFTWDPAGTAQVLNADGTVATPGTRVTDVVLDNGTVIVDSSGTMQAGDSIDIAIVDFLARGGDAYPFRGAPFTVLGISYQQALFSYITASLVDGGLAGVITAAQYPEGGEGRITRLP